MARVFIPTKRTAKIISIPISQNYASIAKNLYPDGIWLIDYNFGSQFINLDSYDYLIDAYLETYALISAAGSGAYIMFGDYDTGETYADSKILVTETSYTLKRSNNFWSSDLLENGEDEYSVFINPPNTWIDNIKIRGIKLILVQNI